MPKYRQLSIDELDGMEEEFARFLAVNGITSDDWVKMKVVEIEGADALLDEFSDMIWETILIKTKYVDLYEQQTISAFHCGDEVLSLRVLVTADDSYDFTTADSINRSKTHPPADLESFASAKAYSQSRELEIFQLLVRGGQISEGQLYESLG